MQLVYAVIAVFSLLSLSRATAGTFEFKFNAGQWAKTQDYADIGWKGYQTHNLGYGWTYQTHDKQSIVRKDRGGEDRILATVALDARPSDVLQPFYTFRVDVPDGRYEIEIQTGDDREDTYTKTTFALGDQFSGPVNESSIDETATTTVIFTSELQKNSDHQTLVQHFDVTQGYLLIGFRKESDSPYWGALNSIVIREISEDQP